MTRVIVTGGAGRLGRSIIDDLTRSGAEVVSFDRALSDSPELADAEQRAIDLTDADETMRAIEDAKADALVHLAAIAIPFSAPEDVLLRTNTQIAMSALGGAVTAGVKKIVAASSPTVLGYGPRWVPDRLPLDEQTPPLPAHAYALSKLLTEQMVQMLHRQTGEETRFASFRPCYVIAPEEWRGAPTTLGHTVRERLDDPALAAPALFNYVDARDAARFVSRLLDALDDVPNAQTFFVGAEDALARHPLAELVPRFFPGTADAASGLVGTTPAFSIEKAQRMLGCSPLHTWRKELQPLTATKSLR